MNRKRHTAPPVILAIANQKGGVGKSTLTLNLGHELARAGRPTLLIDLDPQASLTAMCGVDDPAQSLADVVGGATSGTARLGDILREVRRGLWLAPGDIALAASELGLVSRLGREAVLKRAIAPVAARFERVLIDCPPSLGLLTVAGLAASDSVLIPTEATGVALRALRIFLSTVENVRGEINPALQISGIVPMFFDGRLAHHQAALDALGTLGVAVFQSIPRSVRVAEAATAGKPISEYDPANRAATAYKTLSEEIDQWLKSNKT